MCKLNEAGFMTGVNMFVSATKDNQIVFHAHIGFEDESCDFIVQEIKRGLKAVGYIEIDYYDLEKTMKIETIVKKEEEITDEEIEMIINDSIQR